MDKHERQTTGPCMAAPACSWLVVGGQDRGRVFVNCHSWLCHRTHVGVRDKIAVKDGPSSRAKLRTDGHHRTTSCSDSIRALAGRVV
jgi:hypothetical protein